MSDWRIRLIAREEVAELTTAFHFERPRLLEFIAGQFLDLSLLHPPETDWEGASRVMTIASAPFQNELLFAMRMRDTAFKRILGRLAPGDEVLIDEPAGTFTLHGESSRPAIFLAGGIGITPFLSMVRQATHERRPHRIYLFYCNRRPEDAAFLGELRSLEDENRGFKFVPTMTQPWRTNRKWQGETGHIGIDMIVRYAGSLLGPVHYIAGPPSMIEGTRRKLLEAGVQREDINADPFDGY